MTSGIFRGNAARLSLLFLFFFCAFVVSWSAAVFPFRFYPCDDLKFFLALEGESNPFAARAEKTDLWWKKNMERYARQKEIGRNFPPVHFWTLRFFRGIWTIFAADMGGSLAFAALICNMLAASLAGLLAYRLTRRITAAAAVLVLLGISSWPAEYLFFYSYVPLAGMLSMAAILLICWDCGKDRPRLLLAGPAGLCAGLLVWSSSSGMLTSGLLAGLALLLFAPPARWKALPAFLSFIAAFAVSAGLIAVKYLPFLSAHLKENVTMNNGLDAIRKFGHVPEVPFFSFMRIAWVHNPVIAAGFIAGIAAAAALILRKKEPGLRHPLLPLAAIALFVFSHALAIDLLPATKLARSHYPAYPTAVVFSVCAMTILLSRLKAPAKQYLGFPLLFCFLLAFSLSVKTDREMVRVCRALPDFLEKQGIERLFMFRNDPHILSIPLWLFEWDLRGADEAKNLPEGLGWALLLGPRGKDSGNSMFYHGCLRDFRPPAYPYLPEGGTLKRASFPYSAYFPVFLMDEENCEGLYFSGRMPDYRDEDKQILLLYKADREKMRLPGSNRE